MNEFLLSFKTIGTAVLQIFLLVLFGVFSVKKNIISDAGIKFLSSFIISVTMPCLIFSSMATKFSITAYPDWWIYVLTSVVLIFVSFFVGWFITHIDKRIDEKREFSLVTAFHNATFLPLPLVAILFPREIADRYFVYIFLCSIGFNFLLGSFGALMLSNKPISRIAIKESLTPPFFAVVISIIIAISGLGKFFPTIVLEPINMLGKCTIPLSMIVLGSNIAINLNERFTMSKFMLFELVFVRLFLIPFLMLILLSFINMSRDFKFIFMLEATMPSAISLVTFAKRYDGNVKFISHILLYMYIISLVSIPFWMSVYKMF